METSSGEMVYVLVHDPAYPRDLSSTIFILFKKKKSNSLFWASVH